MMGILIAKLSNNNNNEKCLVSMLMLIIEISRIIIEGRGKIKERILQVVKHETIKIS